MYTYIMISKLEPHIVIGFPFQKMVAFLVEDLAVGRHGPGFRDAEGWILVEKRWRC